MLTTLGSANAARRDACRRVVLPVAAVLGAVVASIGPLSPPAYAAPASAGPVDVKVDTKSPSAKVQAPAPVKVQAPTAPVKVQGPPAPVKADVKVEPSGPKVEVQARPPEVKAVPTAPPAKPVEVKPPVSPVSAPPTSAKPSESKTAQPTKNDDSNRQHNEQASKSPTVTAPSPPQPVRPVEQAAGQLPVAPVVQSPVNTAAAATGSSGQPPDPVQPVTAAATTATTAAVASPHAVDTVQQSLTSTSSSAAATVQSTTQAVAASHPVEQAEADVAAVAAPVVGLAPPAARTVDDQVARVSRTVTQVTRTGVGGSQLPSPVSQVTQTVDAVVSTVAEAPASVMDSAEATIEPAREPVDMADANQQSPVLADPLVGPSSEVAPALTGKGNDAIQSAAPTQSTPIAATSEGRLAAVTEPVVAEPTGQTDSAAVLGDAPAEAAPRELAVLPAADPATTDLLVSSAAVVEPALDQGAGQESVAPLDWPVPETASKVSLIAFRVTTAPVLNPVALASPANGDRGDRRTIGQPLTQLLSGPATDGSGGSEPFSSPQPRPPFDPLNALTTGSPAVLISGSGGSGLGSTLPMLYGALLLVGWRWLRRQLATLPVGLTVSTPAPPG